MLEIVREWGNMISKNLVMLLKVMLLKEAHFNSCFSEVSAHFGISVLIFSVLLCTEIQCVCNCVSMLEQTFLHVKWVIDNSVFCKCIHTASFLWTKWKMTSSWDFYTEMIRKKLSFPFYQDSKYARILLIFFNI